MRRIIIAFCLLGLPFISFGQTINTNTSKITFRISNLNLNTVKGTFQGFSGTVNFNPDDLANSKFDVCVDAASVNTENEKRDKHLRTEDFFEVETYPNICFKSTGITKTKEGFNTTGTLQMHGVEKEVEIPFSYSNNTLTGTLKLKRLDYGIGPSSGFMVGKTVNLEIVCVLN